MTFRIVMKSPDGFIDSIRDAAADEVNRTNYDLVDGADLDMDEFDARVRDKEEELKELCEKWFKYNEYLTVEIDTETETIRGVEQ